VTVSVDDVRHIAQLARLALDHDRVPALVGELNRILDHMDVLQRVEVVGVEADAPGRASAALREDRVAPIPLQHPRESFAPESRDGFVLVPRLATHADEDNAS
jgi:aspartyl-tRNA(Asn)/glutamyl-tRNA(Gln) amidotransferase subunit C